MLTNSKKTTPIIKSAGEIERNKLQKEILLLKLKNFLKFTLNI
jgi:hypothetical protein